MNLFYGNYLRQNESHAGSQKGTPRGIPNQRSVSTQPFNLLTLNPCSTVFRTTAVWARHLEPLLSLPLEADFPVAIGWSWIHWRVLSLHIVLTGEALCLRYYPWSTDNLLKKKTFMYSISFYSEFLWLLPFLLSTGCHVEVRSVHNYNRFLAYVALNRPYITIFMPPQFEPPTV